MTPAERETLRQKLIDAGLVHERQYTRLGVVRLLPGEARTLEEMVSTPTWIRSIVLDSDRPENVAVEGCDYLGQLKTATSFGSTGIPPLWPERPVFVPSGHFIHVIVRNIGKEPIDVSGGVIFDEAAERRVGWAWDEDAVLKALAQRLQGGP